MDAINSWASVTLSELKTFQMGMNGRNPANSADHRPEHDGRFAASLPPGHVCLFIQNACTTGKKVPVYEYVRRGGGEEGKKRDITEAFGSRRKEKSICSAAHISRILSRIPANVFSLLIDGSRRRRCCTLTPLCTILDSIVYILYRLRIAAVPINACVVLLYLPPFLSLNLFMRIYILIIFYRACSIMPGFTYAYQVIIHYSLSIRFVYVLRWSAYACVQTWILP